MKVSIKKLNVEMDIKNKGLELDIYSPNGEEHIGDIIINKTGVIWCRGKKQAKGGVTKSWEELIGLIENN